MCTSEVKTPRGLFISKTHSRGGGGVICEGGLINLEKTMVSVLKYKKVGGRSA